MKQSPSRSDRHGLLGEWQISSSLIFSSSGGDFQSVAVKRRKPQTLRSRFQPRPQPSVPSSLAIGGHDFRDIGGFRIAEMLVDFRQYVIRIVEQARQPEFGWLPVLRIPA